MRRVRRVDIPSRPPPILRYSRWFVESRNTRIFLGGSNTFARVIVYPPMSRSALIKHQRADISKSENYTTFAPFFPSLFDHPCRSIPRLESVPPLPSKKSRSISRCVLERTRARERGRKRNFRNCRNAINSVAGYRGYRGLRRKFRPNNQPCRSFSSTSPHLSLSLSLPIFSFPLHLSPVKRIGETDTPPGTSVFGGVTGSTTKILSAQRGRGTRTKDERHEDGRISRTYIPAAYQWWTLTTGARSWRLAMVAMTGHIRGGIGGLPR